MTLIVAFDPANSTGYCVLEDRKAVLSGQCDFPDAMARVFAALGRRVPDAVAIEYPAIPRGSKPGRAASTLSVGWKAGCLFGRCITLWPTATMWQPQAGTWRKYVGIGGKNRASTIAKAMLWASAELGITLPKGDDDRAMALGLAHATADYLLEKSAEATSSAIARAVLNARAPRSA